jgi:hypothetical protein
MAGAWRQVPWATNASCSGWDTSTCYVR